MLDTIAGPPIVRGYTYELRIAVENETAAIFPDGCELRADVREFAGSAALIAELTTANSGLVRIDDQTVALTIPGEATAAIGNTSVVLDIVRADPDPDVYLAIGLKIPVVRPVTRAVA